MVADSFNVLRTETIGFDLMYFLGFLCLAFRFMFDAMHAVTGAYAKPIFVDNLGAKRVCPGH